MSTVKKTLRLYAPPRSLLLRDVVLYTARFRCGILIKYCPDWKKEGNTFDMPLLVFAHS